LLRKPVQDPQVPAVIPRRFVCIEEARAWCQESSPGTTMRPPFRYRAAYRLRRPPQVSGPGPGCPCPRPGRRLRQPLRALRFTRCDHPRVSRPRRANPAVTAHVPRPDEGLRNGAVIPEARLCTTERAGAHSLQFGTYAVWTAGLLAALAVRPVPSCAASLTRGVNDQPPCDVCSGQAASRFLRWARMLRPDHQYPAGCEMPGILSPPRPAARQREFCDGSGQPQRPAAQLPRCGSRRPRWLRRASALARRRAVRWRVCRGSCGLPILARNPRTHSFPKPHDRHAPVSEGLRVPRGHVPADRVSCRGGYRTGVGTPRRAAVRHAAAQLILRRSE
jgi:hypothetical protein